MVFLAFELQHVATAAGENEDRLVASHQLSADIRLAGHGADRFDQIPLEALHLSDALIGKPSDAHPETAVHEVRRQHDFRPAG